MDVVAVAGGGVAVLGLLGLIWKAFSVVNGAKRVGYEAQAQLAAYKAEVAERWAKKRDLQELETRMHDRVTAAHAKGDKVRDECMSAIQRVDDKVERIRNGPKR